MKFLLCSVSLLLLASCTPMKRAQTSLARGITGSNTIEVNGHEVYCSEGKVCAEIDVLSIWVEDRDGGKVRVVLKNRTGNDALVQLRMEIRAASGEVLMETRPKNIPIPSTEEKSYELSGVARKGATVRILLNTAY